MQKFKIIQLEDQFVNQANQYPFIHSIASKIRFRLRSKMTYDHQPYLLIDKLSTFDQILPLKAHIDLRTQKIQQQFLVIKGQLMEDGAWVAQLPYLPAGVVNFQLVFTRIGQTQSVKFGSCDVILLCQNKHQLRNLRKMTVFPRCIGQYQKWENFFLSQKTLGYNAFHLAPIQETGASNSYYSLKNHLQLSNYIFKGSRQQKIKQLNTLLVNLKEKGIIFFIDIILNHCSFDSEWVKDAPDAVFTIKNTPFLHSAFLVDQCIYYWGEQVKQMAYDVELTEDILVQMQQNLSSRLLQMNLYQYFQISEKYIALMVESVPPRTPSQNIFVKDPVQSIEQFFAAYSSTPNAQRHGISLDLNAWKAFDLIYQERDLAIALTKFNTDWSKKIQTQWIPQIVQNTIGAFRYDYFDNKFRKFDDPYPLVSKYFSKISGTQGDFYALNNGWIGDTDSRDMFVLSKQYYYLRRRVNVWGDLLRIRYGEKPEDSPQAWTYMLQYIQEMAKYFDGFRMDNLHGTQLKVAKYMIQQARKVNPTLIVFAQLFTSSQAQTATFVRQVGINSILKQAQHMLSGQMFVNQFHKKVQLTKPYLGSLNNYFIQNNQRIKYSARKKPIILVYDLTHDNQTYVDKGIHFLQTPISIVLSMMGTFIGSTKGYDQFYAHKIQVTQMQELYSRDPSYPPLEQKSEIYPYIFVFSKACSIFGSWDNWKNANALIYDEKSQKYQLTLYLPYGVYQYKYYIQNQWMLDDQKQANKNNNHQLSITKALKHKKLYRNLEHLRYQTHILAQKYTTYRQYHTFNKGNIVIIIRQSSDHLDSVCMIANLSKTQQIIKVPIQIVGNISSANIWVQSQLSIYEGLTTQSEIAYSQNIHQYFDIKINKQTGFDILDAISLPPGFGCILQCKKNQYQQQIIEQMNQILKRKIQLPPLGPIQHNILLYGCSKEEQIIYGQSNYSIPQSGYKQLVYAGFSGIYHILLRCKKEKRLDDGLFSNLRQGNWLMDYYLYRLKKHKTLNYITEYLEGIFNLIQKLPRYLIPKYFTDFIYNFIAQIQKQASDGIDLKKKLIVASTQFINYFPNCPLSFKILFSAGLPHFSVGWSRCWGRDTFTCSDLLLLYPNIFKETIIQFASVYRHGLIPNLLDEGRRPRYNSRDASWWFIRSISQYIDETKDYSILKTKVKMTFLSNDIFEHNRLKQEGKQKILLLQEIVQAIFQSHIYGISFRQWNSGYQIDSQMNTDGFNIQLQAHESTGFIYGGNLHNCLTWMDKMGSSQKANTKGIPSTSRTGSPIQLVGLLYFCLIKFSKLFESGHYFKEGFIYEGHVITFKQWAQNIMKNFEQSYFLQQSQSSSDYIKGIYKDLHGSKLQYDQIRFRPNALIALAIAPQLFNICNAQLYISKVQKHLIGPKSIGVSTLADNHQMYVPYYDNSDDSNDPKVSHGFSYHNGPQWVWLYGFYLVAKINVSEGRISKKRMMSLLQEHIKYIQSNQWLSLPEITNKNGQYNNFSCHAQAWSISSILMALKRIQKLQQ